ncbi:YkgJ family cysteine cluster protein [Thermococcus gorgonarius]|uniref:Fe-S-cluster oxidoreductase n=1 Tax=Thermococcus gorgonarius TaxID=71997 RepID=A0A2Z2M3F1_THEGO|nr:YkgJ family cysteine cluster protein [Thermococcus gorgonarius]ASJ00170.1 Fe-S-cluster oxidoreductase [Thermococcus gorgonarius]
MNLETRLVATIDLKTLDVTIHSRVKFKCVENCGKCCRELEIPLRDEDIERIEELGYNAWEFVDYEKLFYRGDKFLGYGLKKRPFDDSCVFLDPETKRCRIYKHRPLACRLYPFVFIKKGDKMEVHIKLDSLCPGIDHPEGEPVTAEFILREYGEVIEEYHTKTTKESGTLAERK